MSNRQNAVGTSPRSSVCGEKEDREATRQAELHLGPVVDLMSHFLGDSGS